MPSPIINESTSIVQVDSSGLQNGNVNIVYVSTTTIPGQLVTVVDATGFTSSPQSILLSTVGTALFSDGTTTTSIRQRFGYITLLSENSGNWSIVNSASFPNPTISTLYKGLDAGRINTYIATTSGLVSTGTSAVRDVIANTGFVSRGTLYASTMYINSISSFNRTRPGDYRMTLVGNEYISGPLIVTGSASYRGPIAMDGNLFTIGNISSKIGTIYVGGDVTAGGNIRAQRGNQITTGNASINSNVGCVQSVTMNDIVTSDTFVNSRSINTPSTEGTSINVMSSIIFSNAVQSIQNTRNGIKFVGVSMTVPSTVSTMWLAASNSLATSNLYIQEFVPSNTIRYITLGATIMTNADGSLVTSELQVGTGGIGQTVAANSIEISASATTQEIVMNDGNPNGTTSVVFTDGVHIVDNYWTISSIGLNGTFNAPLASLSTQTILTHGGNAMELNTLNDNITVFTTGRTSVADALYIDGLSNVSIKNVNINNSQGSIMGSITETIQEIYCSSIITDQISTGTVMRFLSPIAATLQDTFISTVTSGKINTSSLTATQITTGFPEYYSTINPSTPWLLTSSFQMNAGDPFMVAEGLGTYFNEASMIAYKNQTTYYSIINPLAQKKIYLSTPYVNSLVGTGIPGPLTSGQPASLAPLGTALSQIAADSSGNVFIGSKDLGWKIQQVTPDGKVSTIAGNYRYFYGDGRYPLGAAFSPQLAVSVSPVGRIIITDISNVRIRALTSDPIVETIAGTGESSYSGDGGLPWLATFSTPVATASDASGNIYVADRDNQIIRQISGSTISTYAGTPGVTGNSGDGGPATAATLSYPFGLATDLSNNVYFTDLSNCAVRQISPSGMISLIAGTYTPGFGGDGGPAIDATLSTPRGIAIDMNSNIYFCDTGNSRVRRIDAITQNITTIAGNGVSAYGGDGGLAVNASLSTPTGVATDLAGNVYISDTDNQCIRYVNMGNNKIATVAGRPRQQGYRGDNSFATFALMNRPSHIAFDIGSGYYYIADDGNARIRYVDPAMKIIYSAAGNGSPLYAGDGGISSDAVFGSIACLTRDSGSNLYIVDDAANTIRVIDLTTNIITGVAGTGIGGFSGEGGDATLARISSPQAVVVDSNANIYFTDRDNQRIRYITAGTISTIAGTGVSGYNGDFISSIDAQLNAPSALAISRNSKTLYVADLNNNRIRAVGTGPSSIITTYAGSGDYGRPTNNTSFVSTSLASTSAIAIDSNAQLYFTDITTNGVWKLNTATNTLKSITATSTTGSYLGDPGPLSNAYFNTPTGLAYDASGNFLIADQGNSRVRATYTYGYPLAAIYLNMNLNYTNYFASTGTAYISLNGNRLKTFYGSNMSNDSYQLNNLNIYNYPLQTSNPVYNDQTPFIEIGQADTYGYTVLNGVLFVQEVPSQGLLENSANSNTGIQMNSGILRFPYKTNGITINNQFNDASMRSIFYSGQLRNASDPALKEDITAADTAICYSTLSSTPLKRYKYIEPYISTFRLQDAHRLGFLTTDVADVFPKSVTPLAHEPHAWIPINTQGLDVGQMKLAHYGVTQHLQSLISTLEWEVENISRRTLAQRNSVL